MLLNTTETFKSLQTFSSIDEMNQTVKEHKKQINSTKLKNAHALLDVISQYSCVYFGVCWLSQRSLADKLGVSYKTVQRAFNKLVELNIITKYECKRAGADKRQTSNIYVINPIQNECDHVEVSTHETPQLISNNINNTNDTEAPARNVDNQSLIKKGLVTKLPQPLQFLEHFFDADELYFVMGTIFKAKSAGNGKDIRIEDYAKDYYHAVLSVLNGYKRNKVKSLHAVLFSSIKAVTRSIWLRDSFSRLLD